MAGSCPAEGPRHFAAAVWRLAILASALTALAHSAELTRSEAFGTEASAFEEEPEVFLEFGGDADADELRVEFLQRGVSMPASSQRQGDHRQAELAEGEGPPYAGWEPIHLGNGPTGPDGKGGVRRRTLVKTEYRSWDSAKSMARDLLGSMTAAEKMSLLHGIEYKFPEQKEGWYTGNIPAIERLGLPALKMQDASSGFRSGAGVPPGTVVAWPSMLALAATWDPALVERVASSIALEFKGKGANMLLGPGVQVHRTAWGGRNFEYLSGEDPHLGSRLAMRYVKGAQESGVMCVAKHFAFNDQETLRFNYSVQVDERTAWELYYPPFEAAVEAGVGAVMCAYNEVNGTHSCTNSELLKRDLKGTMGFDGFVVSDWYAMYNYTHAIDHGLDMDMPGDDDIINTSTVAKLNRGAETEAVSRILASVFKLRLNQGFSCTPPLCLWPRASYRRSRQAIQLAALAATDSIVLLQNIGGILPLMPSGAPKTIAVIGAAAHMGVNMNSSMDLYPDYYSGGGSSKVALASITTPLDAITRRAAAAGMVVVASPSNNITLAMKVAKMADIVIAVVGTSACENYDRTDLNLYDGADAMISAVASERVTVVLMQTPGAVLTPWRENVSAIMNMFLAGEGTGPAWANVLFGDASPAGKLPVMFPETEADTIRPSTVSPITYTEGLFTSYRNPAFKAAFPFGHGLSYATFDYGAPLVLPKDACSADTCVNVTISNTGVHAGAEVVQVYLEFTSAGPEIPKRMLRAFHKTAVLLPGGSEVVEFKLSSRDISLWEPGKGRVPQKDIRMHIGSSSADIRHAVELHLGGA